jgi:hypothetical protein
MYYIWQKEEFYENTAQDLGIFVGKFASHRIISGAIVDLAAGFHRGCRGKMDKTPLDALCFCGSSDGDHIYRRISENAHKRIKNEMEFQKRGALK